MKRVVQLNPLLLLIIAYIPSLTLKLFSHDQAYEPINRATLSLLSSVWLTAGQIVWLWSVGVGLATKFKFSSSNELMALKASLVIPIAYVVLPVITLIGLLVPMNNFFSFLTFDFYKDLHTVSLFCFIYPVFFIPKVLTSIELNRPTAFRQYFSTILTILFFPLGIFFLQPRIRRVINYYPTEPEIN